MTAVLPPTFAGASSSESTGRHRAPADADTGSLGPIPAGMRGRSGHQAPEAPRSTGPSFQRAARTAGLSLAALGALAAAGGTVAHGFSESDGGAPQATGEFQLPTDLAAQHMALAPAAAPAVQPHAVMPAAAPAPAAAQPQIKTVAVQKPAAPKPTRVAAARTEAPAAPAAAPQAAGAKALAAAKQALGTPYEWGGTKPGGFDCSGLMQWAWGKAGKDLPRTSKAQSQEGQKVSTDDLKPGDLVFFYSPVSHVAMYAGNGMVIEAPDEGQDVKMTPLSKLEKNLVSARRV